VSGETSVEVPDQALQAALELAVGVAAAGAKLRPPRAFPSGLKRFLRFQKLPPAALAEVRSAVEGDDGFRQKLASVATPDLVDEIGMLWLSRPAGWLKTIAERLPDKPNDDEAMIRRETRKRLAAEESALRARADVLALTVELKREAASKGVLVADADRLRAELDDVRRRLREAQRAEHAAAQALARAEAELLEVRRTTPETTPDTLEAPSVAAIDVAAARELIDSALTATSDLARLLTAVLGAVVPADEPTTAPSSTPASPQSRAVRRKAVALPGGVLAGSIEGAECFLHTAGARILVDGYNVAKLGWPSLDLDQQRDQCIVAAENLAKRWNIDMAIVFDGAEVEGAHASKRRRVRIVYSPAGVSADDVLRAEVAGIAREQPVVVVTNDRAIITDVVAVGANTVSSDDFLALSRR
jgi:predicted RNA-binding protein with PIN domain